VGEGHSETLFEFVSLALDHYSGLSQLSSHQLPIHPEKDRLQNQVLQFPGKVHAGPTESQLVVSDTGHHRLLVIDQVTGVVQVGVLTMSMM
jgi:hypothetical protein